MKKIIFLAIFCTFTISLFAKEANLMEGKSIYDFQVEDIKGNTINLSDYKGKVLVFVNVASLCGFTPHYAGLEELYEQYKDQGLVILGFPCNQFGEQEPGTEEEILQFCQRTYGVTFPMFSKIDVNGENTHPLYKWLKQNTKGDNQGKDIKWNFTKFLIDREGNVVERFAHNTKPESMEIRIQSFLKKNI